MKIVMKRSGNSVERGFTLLEILIAMSILMSIVLAVTTMLRNSLDIKFALSEKNTVTQKINRVLYKISHDLAHAFILSKKDMLRDGGKGRTIFQIEKGSESDILKMTYLAHKANEANAHEASFSYVVYKLEGSKKYPSRRHLYRGGAPRIPESFKDDPDFKLFADNVSSVRFLPWNGEKFTKEKWDSDNSQTRDKIPHMVLVEVAVWMDDPPEEGESRENDNSVELYSTIVYLGNSLDVPEIKTPPKRFKI